MPRLTTRPPQGSWNSSSTSTKLTEKLLISSTVCECCLPLSPPSFVLNPPFPSCHASKLAVDALLDGFVDLDPTDFPDRTVRIPDITFTVPEFEEEMAMNEVAIMSDGEDDEAQAEAATNGDAEGESDDSDLEDMAPSSVANATSPASTPSAAPKTPQQLRAERKKATKQRLKAAKAAKALWREKEKESPVGLVRCVPF